MNNTANKVLMKCLGKNNIDESFYCPECEFEWTYQATTENWCPACGLAKGKKANWRKGK